MRRAAAISRSFNRYHLLLNPTYDDWKARATQFGHSNLMKIAISMNVYRQIEFSIHCQHNTSDSVCTNGLEGNTLCVCGDFVQTHFGFKCLFGALKVTCECAGGTVIHVNIFHANVLFAITILLQHSACQNELLQHLFDYKIASFCHVLSFMLCRWM